MTFLEKFLAAMFLVVSGWCAFLTYENSSDRTTYEAAALQYEYRLGTVHQNYCTSRSVNTLLYGMLVDSGVSHKQIEDELIKLTDQWKKQ